MCKAAWAGARSIERTIALELLSAAIMIVVAASQFRVGLAVYSRLILNLSQLSDKKFVDDGLHHRRRVISFDRQRRYLTMT